MQTTAIILTIIWTLLSIPSILLAIMSPMMFDAPGSEHDIMLKVLVGSLLTFAGCLVISVISATILLGFEKAQCAFWLSLLPVVPLSVFVITFLLSNAEQAGLE